MIIIKHPQQSRGFRTMPPFSAAMANDEPKTIGEKLAVKRISLDIRQSQLCATLGITQNKLSRIENGKQSPDAELLVKIKEFIDSCADKTLISPPDLSIVYADVEESPIDAATRLHSEFIGLIDAQGDGSNRLDIARERMEEALWWFKSHFGVK
jgi:transcriptional regulator with XRE-family HTH domain